MLKVRDVYDAAVVTATTAGTTGLMWSTLNRHDLQSQLRGALNWRDGAIPSLQVASEKLGALKHEFKAPQFDDIRKATLPDITATTQRLEQSLNQQLQNRIQIRTALLQDINQLDQAVHTADGVTIKTSGGDMTYEQFRAGLTRMTESLTSTDRSKGRWGNLFALTETGSNLSIVQGANGDKDGNITTFVNRLKTHAAGLIDNGAQNQTDIHFLGIYSRFERVMSAVDRNLTEVNTANTVIGKLRSKLGANRVVQWVSGGLAILGVTGMLLNPRDT